MKTKITQSVVAKVAAFLITIVMVFVCIGSIVVAAVMLKNNIFFRSEEALRNETYFNLSEGIAIDIADRVYYRAEADATEICRDNSFASVTVRDFSAAGDLGAELFSYTDPEAAVGKYGYSFYCAVESEGRYLTMIADNATSAETLLLEWEAIGVSVEQCFEVRINLAEKSTGFDKFFFADKVISLAYAMRVWIFVIGVVSALFAVVCFVFLLCAAGHHKGSDKVEAGWATRVPFDLVTVLAGASAAILLYIGFSGSFVYGVATVLFAVIALALILMIGIGWCMSFALRLKLGNLWKNTLVYMVCRLFVRLVRSIPLVPKTVILVSVIVFAEFVAIVASFEWPGLAVIFWFIEKIIIVPFVIYLAVILQRLKKSAGEIASGNVNYHVNTSGMFLDFKEHGETLNRIRDGISSAVEERTKSERMKTELITNVSHDLKTPLTSIINYADLISKEPCDNERITEYSGVLLRQSVRMKRLIDDLVEASKASTGNIEIHMESLDVGVLLSQTMGEYEQKLIDGNLTPMLSLPEEPVIITADGRRLWRVFDNLMNNICKYAMSGTRVWVTVTKAGSTAIISFKNTSRDPINLSAEELSERFVRGDSSRSTEGSGLGLSIAKSLTELQNGTFDIFADGDLFKVEMRFQII